VSAHNAPRQKTGAYSPIHLTVAIAVTYTISPDWRAALAVGLIEPAVQTVAFLIHDRIWSSHRHQAECVKSHSRAGCAIVSER